MCLVLAMLMPIAARGVMDFVLDSKTVMTGFLSMYEIKHLPATLYFQSVNGDAAEGGVTKFGALLHVMHLGKIPNARWWNVNGSVTSKMTADGNMETTVRFDITSSAERRRISTPDLQHADCMYARYRKLASTSGPTQLWPDAMSWNTTIPMHFWGSMSGSILLAVGRDEHISFVGSCMFERIPRTCR